MKFFVTRTARLSTYAVFGVFSGFASVVPQPVAAQQTSQPATLPSAASASDFPLAAGDQVAIVVANHPELSGNGIPVSETGQIAVPVIGNVSVAGKSIAEVQRILISRFKKEVRNPVVSATVTTSAARNVTVLGPVANPGKLNMQPGWHVYDAIVNAGGLLRPGDEIVGSLMRGRIQVPLEVSKLVANPASAANLTLERGDVLNLGLAPGTIVTVQGDVKNPGQMTLRRSWRVLDALMGAGGLNQAPEKTRVTVTHGNQRDTINLQAAFADRNSPANVPLSTGDLISVQAIKTTFAVASGYGLVKTPNAFTMDGRVTVVGAVLAAGNLTVPRSDVKATIRRGDKIIPVNLEKAFQDPNFDLVLEDNDILNVDPPGGPAINISGSVGKSGPMYLKKDARVLDAIVGAGGIVGKPEDTKVTILRNVNDRQVVLNVDSVSLVKLTDLGQNLPLADGDIVMVNPSNSASTVFVTGEVNNPGAFDVKEGEGLTELLLRAGISPNASLRQVRITRRDGTAFVVDASPIFMADGGRIAYDLQQGDRVDVPKNQDQVLVLEAVGKPGYYSVPENGGFTLMKALAAAGGTTAGARIQQIGLIRKLPNGETERTVLALDKVKNGVNVADTAVQPGDIIVVPQPKRSSKGIGSALAILGPLRWILE